MIIPEDGNLPKITRKGFAAFNNIMLIRVPDKFKKPGETTYQFATLDRSKKGERWPADEYVDMLNTPNFKETNSAENSSKCKEDVKKNARKYGKFLPKKFITKNLTGFSKNNKVRSSTPPLCPDTNSNRHFIPNAFQDSQVSHRRFHGDNRFQYDERNFNDTKNNYRHRPNKFSNDHPSYGGPDTGEGTSLNPFTNRYGSQSHTVTATVSRDPSIRDRSYNGDFDFPRNPPVFLNTFVPNPRENDFLIPEISNPNFGLAGRSSDEYFVQNVPNAFDRQIFPSYNSNRPEFTSNNNFEVQPFLHDPMGPVLNAGNNPPPLLPHPPFVNFNDGHFQNNFDGRKPRYDQNSWKNHNQSNPGYNRKGRNQRMHKKPWRGAHNKFSKGNNNRRDNRYERKELS